MPIVNESTEVSFNNTDINMAERDVNRISVDVTVNNAPTLWSILGQWLLSPRQIPFVLATENIQEGPASKSTQGPSSFVTTPRIEGGDIVAERSAEDIEIIPLDRLDIGAQLSQVAAPVRMPHEIYVSHLYPEGHGYPCANPKPKATPIKIGDIGLLVSGRLDVLQNLYQLPESFSSKRPGPMPEIWNEDIFEEGECITPEAGICQTTWHEDGETINEITIRCCDQEGALLVITSPAELSEIESEDLRELRQYLCENASLLLNFLRREHRLLQGSSIYVVTGTILSATWAIATHNKPMHPTYNTLLLKRVAGTSGNQSPFYRWESKGNAQTRTQGHRSQPASKDQCLFLRGFLITASSDFWKKRFETTKVVTDNQETPELQQQHSQNATGLLRGSGDDGSANRDLFLSSATASRPSDLGESEGISVEPFPPEGTSANDYPSFRINNALLDVANTEFSIVHEEDWMEAVKRAAKNRNIGPHADAKFNTREVLQRYAVVDSNGVVSLPEVLREEVYTPLTTLSPMISSPTESNSDLESRKTPEVLRNPSVISSSREKRPTSTSLAQHAFQSVNHHTISKPVEASLMRHSIILRVSSVVLWVYGDDPMRHKLADVEGTHAFTVNVVSQSPNSMTVVKVSRDTDFAHKYPSILGPDNSFLHLGPNNRGGYALYGGNTTQYPMANFRQTGKHKDSVTKYWLAMNGKTYKWELYSPHKMECKDDISLLASWETTPATEKHFAVVTLEPAALPLITEILTSLVVNRIAQANGW